MAFVMPSHKKKKTFTHLPKAFWSFTSHELIKKLGADKKVGLHDAEAKRRIKTFGQNVLHVEKKFKTLRILFSQFNTPFIYMLLFAGTLSLILTDNTDAIIIFGIIAISAILSFIQEKGALDAIKNLQKIVQIKVNVIRDKEEKNIPIEEIVPGDLIVLGAGDMIPGDCYLLESKDLLVDESTMTGESFAVEKSAGNALEEDTPLAKRTNSLFMGTHVLSGTGKCLVVLTGKNTEFGRISEELEKKTPETEFENGVRKFGYFLMKLTIAFLVLIFGFNVFLQRPLIDSLLFALTLSVGLTPQLLPAIITVNLAHGAKKMADEQVIVKKLASIENFGSMNILCADKTGTLTTGKIKLDKACDAKGKESEKVQLYGYLNASFQSGYHNVIDNAIKASTQIDIKEWKKLDELPYNFEKKRISLLVQNGKSNLMITKGALHQVLEICTHAERKGEIVEIGEMNKEIQKHFEDFSHQGYRVLGVAYRENVKTLKPKEEAQMVFLGFLLFMDPPKENIEKTITHLHKLGISLKILTGDNQFAALHLAKVLKIPEEKILLGSEIVNMDEETLSNIALDKAIYAEIEPNQKEKILLALRKTGNVVGYLGDGINDVTALHAADVSISVDSGADAAKEVADIVLLKKDLSVLEDGVKAGRITFANTLKYIFMATSANFGNMFSMAGASLFLSFLPLLPKQVMLTNMLTDFPEMTISTDNVDKVFLDKPLRWNIQFIKRFMWIFGLVSSLFDYATFAVLLFILKASTDQFRTAWFVESVISATVIVLIIRTFKPFYKSIPSFYLLGMVLAVITAVVILPFTTLASYLSFTPLGYKFYIFIALIVALYILATELAKMFFLRPILKKGLSLENKRL